MIFDEIRNSFKNGDNADIKGSINGDDDINENIKKIIVDLDIIHNENIEIFDITYDENNLVNLGIINENYKKILDNNLIDEIIKII
ncbi:654_t:CDS:1, partial [Dentiscutata erythropus]